MRIEFVPRAQWGASQTTENFIAGRRVRTKAEKTEIHVHHTAAIDSNDSTPNRWDYDEAVAYMRRLQTVRPDLGPLPYSENLAVSEDCQTVWIFEGRGLLVSGAHTGGHNVPGIGFGVLGNFNHDDPQAVDALIEAFSPRLTHLRRDEGFTRLGTILSPTGRTVWGHRDSKSTSCPGDHLYVRLGDITLAQPPPQEDETIVSQLPTLRRGDGYPARAHLRQPVRRAQALLAVEGHIAANTFDPQHRPDGLFGPGTEAAVHTFQRARQLPAHGLIDEATWARLLGAAG